MTKQIKIEELIPFMKEGWVACGEDGYWTWFSDEPEMNDGMWFWFNGFVGTYECLSNIFDIAPAEDWTKSLMKVGGK